MTLSDEIQKQIDRINEIDFPAFNKRFNDWSNERWFTSAQGDAHNALGNILPKEREALENRLSSLTTQLNEQLNKELNEIKIETKLDIPPNTLNQLGESIEPITTQLKKPENQGLLLIAGLVTAAIVLS